MSNFKCTMCRQTEIDLLAHFFGVIHLNTFLTNLLIRLVVNYVIYMISNRHHSMLTFY